MVQQSTINTATVYALRSYFCLEDGFDISGPNMLWLRMAVNQAKEHNYFSCCCVFSY